MRSLVRWAVPALRLVAAGAAFGAAIGWLGAVHPAFDSVGHFRAHLAALAVVAGLAAIVLSPFARRLARPRPSVPIDAWASLAAGIAVVVLAAPYLVGISTPPDLANGGFAAGRVSSDRKAPYTLLQMNLRFDAAPEEALRRLAERAPDVVTLQEVEDRWRERLETVSGTFPYRVYCRKGYSVGDTAILSRRPFVEGGAFCAPRDGFLAQRVDFDGVAVTIVAQHLEWPWPFRHWRQIANLRAPLARLDGPVLVGGDFNAAPWSAAVATYAAQGGLRIVRAIGPTWGPFRKSWIPMAGLPIDQILASPEVAVISAETLAPTASDHLPVLVTFAIGEPDAAPPD